MKLWTYHNRLFYVAFRLKNPWQKRGGKAIERPDDERCLATTRAGNRCKRRREYYGYFYQSLDNCQRFCDQHCRIKKHSSEHRPTRTKAKTEIAEDIQRGLLVAGISR
jgi:hypothetical protein